jgi:hypothetical protein
MVWGEEQEKAFKEIKKVFTNAPALCLVDVMKPFFLYVHERLGTAVGVLTQLLGSWYHTVTYLSKQLDSLGQELTIQVPHSVLTLMEYKGNYWLTNSRMVIYQIMLCENP